MTENVAEGHGIGLVESGGFLTIQFAAGVSALWSGTGAPASGLGIDGDYYIDSAANALYGPKTDSGWGSAVTLGGILRSVSVVAADATAGANRNTDYVHIVTAPGVTVLYPTAVGNTNRHTLINASSGPVYGASSSGQTFDGAASPTTVAAQQSNDFISDGANWRIS
jgi:hypothetical protein